MPVDEEARRKRIAGNESLFRAINEKIEDVSHDFGLATQSMAIICECGDISCTQQIEIELQAYEDVRSDPTWFVVVPGHEVADVEDVVAHHPGFDVVCKHKGAGEAVAIATDPRN
jgi:hypothetical protein